MAQSVGVCVGRRHDIAQRACGERAWGIVRACARVRARVRARKRACACVRDLAHGRQRCQALRHVRRASGCNRCSLPPRTTAHHTPTPTSTRLRAASASAARRACSCTQSKQTSTHTGGHKGCGDTRALGDSTGRSRAPGYQATRLASVATGCCARTSARFWAASASARTRAVSACTKQAHVRGSTPAQGETRTAGRHQAQGQLAARQITARGP
jgi:hypothetical protein